MVNNKTYNNVIDTLKNLGTNHLQISTTTVGDIFDIDLEKNTLYPLMHLNPVNVTTRRTELVYNFQDHQLEDYNQNLHLYEIVIHQM